MSEEFSNNQEAQEPEKDSLTADIDDIQQSIIKKMIEDEKNSPDYLDEFETNPDNIPDESGEADNLENEFYDIAPLEKKYVIAVNPDNVPFFDKLVPEERALLINKLLAQHQEESKIEPEKLRVKKFIKHVAVVFITIAVGMPLIFFTVNTSIEATVNSYRQVQHNFEKLYQQKGGIKRKDLTKIQNLQY